MASAERSRLEAASTLLTLADRLSEQLEGDQSRESQAEKGQYTTPSEAAATIASSLDSGRLPSRIRVLDAGAGAGALTLAFVAELMTIDFRGAVEVDLVENDPAALAVLPIVIRALESIDDGFAIDVVARIVERDFCLDPEARPRDHYHVALLNPPYMKLAKGQPEREAVIRAGGVECPNLYAAFVVLATLSLCDGGQLVAITPRSFANGAYFRQVRQFLLRHLVFRQVVVFDRRDRVFARSAVLQETIIYRADRSERPQQGEVEIITRIDHVSPPTGRHRVPAAVFVVDGDPQMFFNFPGDDQALTAAQTVSANPFSLGELGLKVSTGQVVDFRAREWLLHQEEPGAVPLLYPQNIRAGDTVWPVESKKPQYFRSADAPSKLLMPQGTYVLVKRFTSKEERRRVVAAIYRPVADTTSVAFENHLNVFHRGGRPLAEEEAVALSAFLNSDAVDQFFRTFSGSTQVNATDLRRIRYPSLGCRTVSQPDLFESAELSS